jgi:hypothetical protein
VVGGKTGILATIIDRMLKKPASIRRLLLGLFGLSRLFG